MTSLALSLETIVLLGQAIWVYNHLPVMIFVFMFGACVGSFINVVNYRIPAGMSVASPPSRCPTCGARLSFFRDNVPIVGWLVLRGKCRYCKVSIRPEYMLVELFMATIFVGLYVILYVVPTETPFFGQIAGPWWFGGRFGNGFFGSIPAFIAFAFLLAGLFSMTVIDARTFTIPIQIPLFVTFTAFIAYPVQALFPMRIVSGQDWPIVTGDWLWAGASIGGMAGVVVAVVLLRVGFLRHSFADYDEYLTDEHEVLADYPHARREMLVEMRFLMPILIGLSGGWLLARWLAADGSVPPVMVQALTGTFAGYLMGAGLIWAIRILGTFGFGREAMGMGDVHLLGAVGAVLGWLDPIFIFFVAPFSGILWALISLGLGTVFKGLRRELPYGPHLAAATVIVMILAQPVIYPVFGQYMGFALPQPGLVHPPSTP